MTFSDPFIICIALPPGLVTIKTESVNQGIQASGSPLALQASGLVSHYSPWNSMGIQIQMAVLCQEQGFWASPAETTGHKPASITAAGLEMYCIRHS